jgi:hypothetical protein
VRKWHAGGIVRAVTFAAVLAILAFAVLFGGPRGPREARAAGVPPDGGWNMTAVTETFTVQQWSPTCGPAPVSGTAMLGGPVKVRSDGPELVIEGGPRVLRTDGCIDPMPTLSRDSHTGDGQSWRTRCSTPPSDPRHAVINTGYFLTSPDTLSIAETGRYELTINSAHCVADVKRDASLSRIVLAPAASPTAAAPRPVAQPVAPVAAAPAPPAAAKPDCSTPGDPARLEVRPSRKLLRLGESFGFHALVVDGEGCPTSTGIQWTIGALKFKDGQSRTVVPTIDGGGKLTVPADFPEATFDVVATTAGHAARSSVDVTSPANYEALLTGSGLDSNGEREEPSVALLATGSIGSSDVHAEDGAKQRRLIFVGIILSIAVALGIVAVVAARRSQKAVVAVEREAEDRHAQRMQDYERQKRDREEKHAAQMRAHKESVAVAQEAAAAAAARGVDSGPMFCPSCRREFSSGSTYCPFDANRLVAIAGHRNLMGGPAGGICPTCKRGFNPGIKVCPHDGDELLPPAAITAAMAPPAPVRGKICPTCGGRFDGTAGFCGKDGTQLVLLN